MYSPASQKLAVGSTVNENVESAVINTTKATILFKKSSQIYSSSNTKINIICGMICYFFLRIN